MSLSEHNLTAISLYILISSKEIGARSVLTAQLADASVGYLTFSLHKTSRGYKRDS